QAEDGIRDRNVTGVQTCALPISQSAYAIAGFQNDGVDVVLLTGDNEAVAQQVSTELNINHYKASMLPEDKIAYVTQSQDKQHVEIGRASCRERVKESGLEGTLEK